MTEQLLTKADIARIYGKTERTVSNWLARARAENGDEFPGKTVGNALGFNDEDLEVLLQYSNGAEPVGKRPTTKVIEPEIIDMEGEEISPEFISHQVSSLVPVKIELMPVRRRFADLTGIEARQERLENLTQVNASQAAQGMSALGEALGREVQAQMKELAATMIAQGAAAMNKAVNEGV